MGTNASSITYVDVPSWFPKDEYRTEFAKIIRESKFEDEKLQKIKDLNIQLTKLIPCLVVDTKLTKKGFLGLKQTFEVRSRTRNFRSSFNFRPLLTERFGLHCLTTVPFGRLIGNVDLQYLIPSNFGIIISAICPFTYENLFYRELPSFFTKFKVFNDDFGSTKWVQYDFQTGVKNLFPLGEIRAQFLFANEQFGDRTKYYKFSSAALANKSYVLYQHFPYIEDQLWLQLKRNTEAGFVFNSGIKPLVKLSALQKLSIGKQSVFSLHFGEGLLFAPDIPNPELFYEGGAPLFRGFKYRGFKTSNGIGTDMYLACGFDARAPTSSSFPEYGAHTFMNFMWGRAHIINDSNVRRYLSAITLGIGYSIPLKESRAAEINLSFALSNHHTKTSLITITIDPK